MNGKKLALLSGLLLTTACTSTTKTKDVLPLTTNSPVLQSPEEEKLLRKSQRAHDELVEKGLIVRNVAANNYVASIASTLAPAFNHPQIKLNYYILKDASVNASALPNGNIYLNVGLITKLASEEQLAFVIAHEIAHVVKRHGLLKTISSKNTIASSHVVNMFLMGTNIIYFATLNDLASFSRETEDEADYEAMKIIAQTNINLNEGAEAIRRLKQVKHAKESSSIWGSHDSIEDRIDTYYQRVEQHQWNLSTSEPAIENYQIFRAELAKQVIDIRIRNKQFELAEDVISQELELAPKNAMLYFYLGEVNRLKVQEFEAAAKEYSWLYDQKNDEKLKALLRENHIAYLDSAKQSYEKAIAIDETFTLSYRGLGMLALAENEKEKAKYLFNKYLKTDGIRDRRYIESLRDSI